MINIRKVLKGQKVLPAVKAQLVQEVFQAIPDLLAHLMVTYYLMGMHYLMVTLAFLVTLIFLATL
jgi:hypothetical protein